MSRLMIGVMSIGIVSCTQDLEVLDDFQRTFKTEIGSIAISSSDSISLFSNEDSLQKPQTRAYSYYPTDEYYSSNMWAVRELPFALKVRGSAVSSKPYFTTQGTRKELILSSSNNSKFFLKILPASSGIPYLIYSKSYNKPLVCGQYNNSPNNKLVFVWDTENVSSGSWDLIPSAYKGYFAIENETYLGTEDPNNPWSIFNYAIEAKTSGQIGYAKYNKQPLQEFLLEFEDKFNVKEILFDPESAVVTQLAPVIVNSSGQTSPVAGPSNITIYAEKKVTDTSRYTEKGALMIPMSIPNQMFLRPTVIADQFVSPDNFSSGEQPDTTLFVPRAPYTSQTFNIPRKLSFTIPVKVQEPSYVKVTSYLKQYSVKADYTITMTYRKSGELNDREVKFKGTWTGTINTTSRAKPDNIVAKPLDENMLKQLKKQIINKQLK